MPLASMQAWPVTPNECWPPTPADNLVHLSANTLTYSQSSLWTIPILDGATYQAGFSDKFFANGDVSMISAMPIEHAPMISETMMPPPPSHDPPPFLPDASTPSSDCP